MTEDGLDRKVIPRRPSLIRHGDIAGVDSTLLKGDLCRDPCAATSVIVMEATDLLIPQ